MFDHRVHIVWIVIASIAATLGCFVSSATAVQFQDSFDELDPIWGDSTDEKFVQEGVLVLKPQAGKIRSVLYQGAFFDDIDYSLRMRRSAGEATNWGSGPIFWAESYEEYYMLTVATNGKFAVQRKTRGKWLTPISWRDSEAIIQGLNEWNELRVVTEGTKATIHINGTEILTFTGHPPEGGSFIGIEADSANDEGLTWEFDDLKIE